MGGDTFILINIKYCVIRAYIALYGYCGVISNHITSIPRPFQLGMTPV